MQTFSGWIRANGLFLSELCLCCYRYIFRALRCALEPLLPHWQYSCHSFHSSGFMFIKSHFVACPSVQGHAWHLRPLTFAVPFIASSIGKCTINGGTLQSATSAWHQGWHKPLIHSDMNLRLKRSSLMRFFSQCWSRSGGYPCRNLAA